MFIDYYQILGITSSASIDEIKAAYHKQAKKWHPDIHPNLDTTEQMKAINEAYSILSNPQSRLRYNNEYQKYCRIKYCSVYESPDSKSNEDYHIQDEKLKEDIEIARKRAEEYVREFLSSLKEDSNKAVKGAWQGAKPILVLAIIGTIGLIISLSLFEQDNFSEQALTEAVLPTITEVDSTATENAESNITDNWITYNCGNSFELSVPPTVELQKEDDAYTQYMKRYIDTSQAIIFQQKGLSDLEEQAFEKYCRIMIEYHRGENGHFLNSTETEPLNNEWKSIFDSLVKHVIGPASNIMGEYQYKWVNINGIKCIQIDYKRTGSNFDTSRPVTCRIGIFQNNNELVKLIIAYREKEADMWKEDFEKAFASFKWI